MGRATGGSGRGRDGLGFAFAPKREAAGKNLVSNFVARSEGEGIRPNAQRIRATWVVDHLQSGTPVLNLMELAGVRSLARCTFALRAVRWCRGLEPALDVRVYPHRRLPYRLFVAS